LHLSLTHGGTGVGTFTTNGVLYGNGTGALNATAAGTSAQLLIANGSGVPTFVSLSSDATITNAGVFTISANAVALGTDTTGDYISTITAGNGIATTGASTGETIAHTLSVSLLGAADSVGATSSNSGLEFAGASSNQLSLLQGCANLDVLAWN
jgi:hypothetical protein